MKKLILLIPLFLLSCENRESENNCDCKKVYYEKQYYTIVNQNNQVLFLSRFVSTGVVEKSYQCTSTDFVKISETYYYKINCINK